MNEENIVIFKGRKDGILVMLDAKIEFEKIKEVLKQKASEASGFFADASTAIMFSGRELNEHEEIELIEIFNEVTNLDITYVTVKGNNADKKKKKPSKSTAPEEPSATVDETEKFLQSENQTLFHRGSLRSGQSICYAGSVVMYGDLNPGAEIVAEGNIIILGYAKGLLHAGCSGNNSCYIFSLNLQPTQLRISELIFYEHYDQISKLKTRSEPKPTFARISDKKIVLETKEKF